MSKRRHRVERAQATPGGGVLIPQHIIASAIAMMKQNNNTKDRTDLFSPGQPMDPQKGTNPNNWPRQWNFPIAYNTTSPDRTLQDPEIPSFQQLRKLATLYDGIMLCEKVWLDMIPTLDVKVTLRKELQDDSVDITGYQSQIDAIMALMRKPDGIRGLHSWLRVAITEQTQIDALCIYKQKDRMGRLQSLKIVAGDTIKPLLDDWGNTIAYQQFPWGIPGNVFTPDQMIYFTESPSASTPYGRSRVERIMLRINQALRKENKDLAYYTEGNQPFAIMEVPEASNWTPDQVEVFEQLWNALTAGSAQQQVRVKFTQAGMKYTPLEQYQLDTAFDQFLLNMAVADYGLSMADIGFTGDIHKSSDKGQQNMLYRRTLGPIVSMYAGLLTDIVQNDMGEPDLQIEFSGYEEEDDITAQANAYHIMIESAMISPANAAHAMKLPDIPETGPLFITATGIVPLANYEEGSPLRKAADTAALANSQMSVETLNSQKIADQQAQQGGGDTQQSGQDEEGQEDDQEAQRAINADYKRWREVALKDVRVGKPVRSFASSVIPAQEYNRFSDALQRCTTADEVRAVFRGDSPFFVEAADSGGNQQSSKLLWRNTPLISSGNSSEPEK